MPDRIIVADTSVLIALSNIDELGILEKLYGSVLVTPQVSDEGIAWLDLDYEFSANAHNPAVLGIVGKKAFARNSIVVWALDWYDVENSTKEANDSFSEALNTSY